MRTNTVKQKLLRGEPSIGAEAMSRVGFDYVVVAMQHGAWTEESVMNAFRAIALGPALPMARVRSNDFGLIGRLLDIGALGVIIPLVNSVEDAEKAVLAARYPPLGGRSGGNFGTGFLSDDPDDYQKVANEEIFLAVQIESAPAVESAEAILAVEGIDGCWIGPGTCRRRWGRLRGRRSTRRLSGRLSRRVIRRGRYRGSRWGKLSLRGSGSVKGAGS